MATSAGSVSGGDGGFFVTALWHQQGRWGRLIQVLETAEKFGRAPSHWLGGLDGEWGKKDHILTLALTAYKDGLCACGKPLLIAHHEDNDGWYSAKSTVCHACAAMDRKRDSGDEMQPGEKAYPSYDRPADKPLPARNADD